MGSYVSSLVDVGECVKRMHSMDENDESFSENVECINNEIRTHVYHSFLNTGKTFTTEKDITSFVKEVINNSTRKRPNNNLLEIDGKNSISESLYETDSDEDGSNNDDDNDDAEAERE